MFFDSVGRQESISLTGVETSVVNMSKPLLAWGNSHIGAFEYLKNKSLNITKTEIPILFRLEFT